MRTIPLDEETLQYTYKEFSERVFTVAQLHGYISENQLQHYWDKPLSQRYDGCHSDPGYDFVCNGIKVDAKSVDYSEQYFGRNTWLVLTDDNGNLGADVYVYTVLDLDKKVLHIIGYNTKEEIEALDIIPRGTYHKRIGRPNHKPAYIVGYEHIHEII